MIGLAATPAPSGRPKPLAGSAQAKGGLIVIREAKPGAAHVADGQHGSTAVPPSGVQVVAS